MSLVITILENELGVKDDNWNLAMLLKKMDCRPCISSNFELLSGKGPSINYVVSKSELCILNLSTSNTVSTCRVASSVICNIFRQDIFRDIFYRILEVSEKELKNVKDCSL